MNKVLLIILLGIIMPLRGFSQYFQVYSQYMMNGLTINPAYAGSRDVLSATLSYREQWVGFEGAPSALSLGVHFPLKNEKIALGSLVYNESEGLYNKTGLYGIYAYRIRMGKGKLAFGLKAGLDVLSERNTKVTLHDQTQDVAFQDVKSAMMPNFGFGAYYSNSDFFTGLSFPLLLSYNGNGELSKSGNHYYDVLITGGYLYKVSENFKLKPSTLIKYKVNSGFQYDLNLNAIFFKNDLLWTGFSYRNKETMIVLVEIQINRQFRLGYSYDYSIGPLKGYNSGSHELTLRFEWREKIDTLNPLYF